LPRLQNKTFITIRRDIFQKNKPETTATDGENNMPIIGRNFMDVEREREEEEKEAMERATQAAIAATIAGEPENLEEALNADANPNAERGRRSILYLALNSNLEGERIKKCVELLLEAGAKVEENFLKGHIFDKLRCFASQRESNQSEDYAEIIRLLQEHHESQAREASLALSA
jgi:riboflavin biosynthesis pyrimidine reductase